MAEGPAKRSRSGSGPEKLWLHFDVNETILVGDPAGGDTFEDCLNKILAKSAFIRRREKNGHEPTGQWTDWVWHDGSPLDPAERGPDSAPPPLLDPWKPPEGCLQFYTADKALSRFNKLFSVEGPGVIYRAEWEKLREALRWPSDGPEDPRLIQKEGEEKFYTILPAFFVTLVELSEREEMVSVVLRTFGEDLPRVADAINAFAEGKHPLFREAKPEWKLNADNLWKGKYRKDGCFELSQLSGGSPKTYGEDKAVAMLQSASISGVVDDYDWWNSHGKAPESGKPLWLTLDESPSRVRPIFFDDNIKNLQRDSIVAVRVRESTAKQFVPVTGELTCQLHGAVMRKVPTWGPILRHRWFLEEIQKCRDRSVALRQENGSGLWAELRTLASAAKPALEKESWCCLPFLSDRERC
eukprot:TRINITY_DN18949_c0_g1_i1.p1 TRINITY_DN18949_c0_g1~~TRINITY_DN18949_c0_g1_i1.p1  ORF type:complete len:412 (+),score=89.43 TRINITY_DN18949_c0_g1_i1:74-1309(+)